MLAPPGMVKGGACHYVSLKQNDYRPWPVAEYARMHAQMTNPDKASSIGQNSARRAGRDCGTELYVSSKQNDFRAYDPEEYRKREAPRHEVVATTAPSATDKERFVSSKQLDFKAYAPAEYCRRHDNKPELQAQAASKRAGTEHYLSSKQQAYARYDPAVYRQQILSGKMLGRVESNPAPREPRTIHAENYSSTKGSDFRAWDPNEYRAASSGKRAR